MLKGFKAFILRGNVIDLAVAVVIGVAFGAVVTSFTTNLLTPLIAAIFGEPNFSKLAFTINGSQFFYGAFLNAILSFLFIALAVYLFVVKPLNTMAERRAKSERATTRDCPHCLSEIAVEAGVCAHCTREVPSAA